MIGQMATAITTFLFNIILMRLAGSDGVAAMTILFYGQFLFNAFYLGFAIGIAPVVGYQYGAGNRKMCIRDRSRSSRCISTAVI